MGSWIVLEIGKSVYTEFLMKDGEFRQTEDCIMLARVNASSEKEAIEKTKEINYCKNREFDFLVAYELKNFD